MAEKPNNKVAVAFRDGLVWKVVSGFEDVEAGVRWFRHAGIDNFHALREKKSGRPATLEVVSLSEINKRKNLTQTWREAEETRAREIAEAEAEARRLAEEKAAAEKAAARAAEVERIALEKFREEQRAKLAQLRAEAEAEVDRREQGDAQQPEVLWNGPAPLAGPFCLYPEER